MPGARLGLHLTDRCQLDCDHCLRDPAQRPKDLPLELIERLLDEARDGYAIRQVSLTGGEPTLHPQFESVLDAIAARGLGWDMVSNGHRFASVLERLVARPARLASLRSMSFSLDSADETEHDGIRERGSYRDVMQAVALAAAQQVPFGIQMAVHARNEAGLEQLGLLAAQLGAKHVSFAWTQPTGTAHDADFFLAPHAWRRVKERVIRLSQVLSITVVLAQGHHEESLFTSCAAFRSETLHVDVEGRLTLCCLHAGIPGHTPDNDVAGDLRQMSLADAHRRLLEMIHSAQLRKLDALSASSPRSEWAHFPCNACLADFGRPHWQDAGAAGPNARRERWRGAWAPEARASGEPLAEPRRLKLLGRS